MEVGGLEGVQLRRAHLYQHDVVVVGGVVVVGVGHQDLGENLLLCAFVDTEGVVACHHHHPV